MDIGKRLREEREKQGLTLRELARRAGVGVSTIAELEAGRRQSTTKVVELAQALAVNPDWLQTGSGQKDVLRRGAYISADSLEDLARQMLARGNDEVTAFLRLILEAKDTRR